MDLGKTRAIKGLYTQGRPNQWNQYPKTFYVWYSTNDNTGPWVIIGDSNGSADTWSPNSPYVNTDNTDNNTIFLGTFSTGVQTRYVKVAPRSWVGGATFRCEVALVDVIQPPVSGFIEKTLLKPYITTTYLPWTETVAPTADRTTSANIESNRTGAASGINNTSHWRPNYTPNTNQWIVLDLGSKMSVAGIITQSGYNRSEWVKTATVDISDDNSTWTNVDSGATFTLNTERNTAVNAIFASPVTTRYVKVMPQTWQTSIEMRVDVLLTNIDSSGVFLNNTTNMKSTDGEIQLTNSDDSIHKIKYGSFTSTAAYGVYEYPEITSTTAVVPETSRSYSNVYNNDSPGLDMHDQQLIL